MLSSSTDFSRLIAKALSDSTLDHSARYPISLVVVDNRLQIVGLLTKTSVEAVESSLESGSNASEHNESESDSKMSEDSASFGDAERRQVERCRTVPTTIQDKYKLPSMEWKTKSSAPGAVNLSEGRPINENCQEDEPANTTRTSKLRRVDYNERVTSVIQRVETLSGVMESMRTSFQLFSSEVQQHMNLVSEQLEGISRRRETAQPSRTG